MKFESKIDMVIEAIALESSKELGYQIESKNAILNKLSETSYQVDFQEILTTCFGIFNSIYKSAKVFAVINVSDKEKDNYFIELLLHWKNRRIGSNTETINRFRIKINDFRSDFCTITYDEKTLFFG
jgi:hypothetical protein